jgi:hypothetical protein
MGMKIANYYVFNAIWLLLERMQLMHDIDFENWDLDDPSIIQAIVQKYIAPAISRAPPETPEKVRSAFEYYLTTGNAPLQHLRDRLQELMLGDDDNPRAFLLAVGKQLYGDDFLMEVDPTEYVEHLDESDVQL